MNCVHSMVSPWSHLPKLPPARACGHTGWPVNAERSMLYHDTAITTGGHTCWPVNAERSMLYHDTAITTGGHSCWPVNAERGHRAWFRVAIRASCTCLTVGRPLCVSSMVPTSCMVPSRGATPARLICAGTGARFRVAHGFGAHAGHWPASQLYLYRLIESGL